MGLKFWKDDDAIERVVIGLAFLVVIFSILFDKSSPARDQPVAEATAPATFRVDPPSTRFKTGGQMICSIPAGSPCTCVCPDAGSATVDE